MNDSSVQKKIFFHVGMERTGTTHLQQKVFPSFKNVFFVKKRDFHSTIPIINDIESDKILLSHEFDLTFEEEVISFANQYPDAYPIITFRKHESWLLSKYKRHIKVGYSTSIENYLDLQNDNGYCKIESLKYFNKLSLLEKHFNNKPLVLFYDELKKDAFNYIDQIANFIACDYEKGLELNSKTHMSYSNKQLKSLLWVNSKFRVRDSNNRLRINKSLYQIIKNVTVRLSLVLPNLLIEPDTFYPENFSNKINEYFENDWKDILSHTNRI